MIAGVVPELSDEIQRAETLFVTTDAGIWRSTQVLPSGQAGLGIVVTDGQGRYDHFSFGLPPVVALSTVLEWLTKLSGEPSCLHCGCC